MRAKGSTSNFWGRHECAFVIFNRFYLFQHLLPLKFGKNIENISFSLNVDVFVVIFGYGLEFVILNSNKMHPTPMKEKATQILRAHRQKLKCRHFRKVLILAEGEEFFASGRT